MFSTGFKKMATTLVTMTPEEYYEVVREKDPFVGSTAGGLAGAAIGARMGARGQKGRAALIGAGTGVAGGAVTAVLGGKLLRKHQAKKVHRMADDLNLRSTPHRRD